MLYQVMAGYSISDGTQFEGSPFPKSRDQSYPYAFAWLCFTTEAPQRISSVVLRWPTSSSEAGGNVSSRYAATYSRRNRCRSSNGCRRPLQTLRHSWALVWSRKPCPPTSFAAPLMEACPTAVVLQTPAPRIGRPPGLPPLAPGSRARDRSARAGPRVSRSREALR